MTEKLGPFVDVHVPMPTRFVPVRIEVSRDWLRDMVGVMPALQHGTLIGAEAGQRIELLAADDVGPDEAVITGRDGQEGTTTIAEVLYALRLDGALAQALMERRRLLLDHDKLDRSVERLRELFPKSE